MKLFLLSAIVAVAFCYDIDPSGYGGNDAEAVKKVAAASPRVRPRDYTSNGKPINDPVVPKYNVPSAAEIIGNKFNLQNLQQNNNQGQSSVQVGGEQTNVGSNANAINIGQTNQNGGGKGSGYPAPQYDSKYAPSYPQPNTYVPQVPSYGGAGAGDVIKNNLFNMQNLGQTSSQGQENVQVGGAQTNVGSNSNSINLGQTNNNAGQGKGSGYPAPQYDSKYAPSYPQPTYTQQPSYAQYLPQNIFAGNKIDSKELAQNNNQGQSSTQVGGAQTNVGSNANNINIGQTNNNGGSGAGYGAPQYDSSKYAPSYVQPQGYQQQPSYGSVGQYLPQNIFAGNKVDYTGLAQNNQQGQSNTQVGGAQTNVGSNANAINIGQTNQNGGQGSGSGYNAPQYDSKYAPSYPQQPSYPSYGSGAGYIPQNIFAGNKVDYTGLAQGNNQGQSSVQQGGAQTNVGQNTNAINIGQTNNNGGQGSGYGAPQYDSKYAPSYPQPNTYVPQVPSYGGAGAGDVIKNNLFNMQNLGQTNNQGQSSVQVGGEQTNVGSNANAINIGQTNQNGGGKGSGYPAPQYDAPVGYLLLKNQPQNYFGNNDIWSQMMNQNNQQGQSNTQVGGAQTNVGQNTNTVNIGQTNNNGGGKGPQYDAYRPTGYGAMGSGYAGQFFPQNIFAGNLVNTKDLAQNNAQGQSSVQKGGDQLNLNTNQNTINVGQTNNNGGGNSGASYDSKMKPAVMPVKYTKPEPEPEQSYRRRA